MLARYLSGAALLFLLCFCSETSLTPPRRPEVACRELTRERLLETHQGLPNANIFLFRRLTYDFYDEDPVTEAASVRHLHGCLSPLCNGGDESACANLAHLYMQHGATAGDREAAFAHLKTFCEKGFKAACPQVGTYLNATNRSGDAYPYLSAECQAPQEDFGNGLGPSQNCLYAARAAEESGNLKEAEKHYRLFCGETQGDNCTDLGAFYLKYKQYKKAEPVLRQACFGNGSDDNCLGLAKIQLEQNRNREAFRRIAIYSCQNKESPNQSNAAALGLLLLKQGFKREALPCLKKSCGPGAWGGCSELARLYMENGQTELAASALEHEREALRFVCRGPNCGKAR